MSYILKLPFELMLLISFIEFYLMANSQSLNNDKQLTELPGGTDTLIVNGKKAEAGKFPWMVALYHNEEYRCTASLIAPDLVLTAAHCVTVDPEKNVTSPVSSFYGVVGNTNRKVDDTRLFFNKLVIDSYYYPYLNRDKDQLTGDIAIFWVSNPVTLTDLIKPISLTSAGRKFNGKNVTAMGWGRTEKGYPNTLMFTQLQVEDIEICKTKVEGVAVKVICADSKERTGVCFGDSGGPLVYQDPSGVPIQIGVVSFDIGGNACVPEKVIDVYTAVADYNEWIIEQVGNNSGIRFV